jgi:hypothetical protein
MVSRDAHERRYRRGQPPGGEVMPSERSPRHDHREQSQKQPEVPEADVHLLVVRNARPASRETLNVFFGGKHWLKI